MSTQKRPKWASKIPNLESKILLFSRGKNNPILSERDALIWAINITTPHWIDFIERNFEPKK